MNIDLDPREFRYDGEKAFSLKKHPTELKKRLCRDDAALETQVALFRHEIDELQQQMYAHDRYAMLLVFQALDAAGKDGTIRHVMSGVNPHGIEVHAFKEPSREELEHDYLWRAAKVCPTRGKIGIFNRSYYEDVLVVKVHPELLATQRLPESATRDSKKLWKRRYEEIRNFEAMLHANGTHVVKFFLNVSKAEQKKRLLARIEKPGKNWKFNAGDIAERARWDDYMAAYSDAIAATATKAGPWYVVPADNKGEMRLVVSAAILHEMQKLKLDWPQLPKEQRAALVAAKKALQAERD